MNVWTRRVVHMRLNIHVHNFVQVTSFVMSVLIISNVYVIAGSNLLRLESVFIWWFGRVLPNVHDEMVV